MEKENWKDDVLHSLDGIESAAPPAELYGKIRYKVLNMRQLQVVRRSYIAVAAAGLALLLTANIWVLSSTRTVGNTPSVYQIEQANFNLY